MDTRTPRWVAFFGHEFLKLALILVLCLEVWVGGARMGDAIRFHRGRSGGVEPLAPTSSSRVREGDRLPGLTLRRLHGPREAIQAGPRGAWVLFVEDCVGCAEGALATVQSALSEVATMPGYVVVRLKPEGAQPQLSPSTSVLLDPTGECWERMGVTWSPRLYLLDRRGRISFVQRHAVIGEQVLTEALAISSRRSTR